VNAVTVRADRSARHATRHRLTVNALNELSAFGSMTLSASRRDVDFRNRRLRIRCRQNIVTVVAIAANRGTCVTAGDRFRVDTFSIREKRPIANAASLHYRLVTVTTATGLGNGRSVDCRIWIAARQNGRHVAIPGVAIKTRRRLHAILQRLRVKPTTIGGVRFSMKE